MNLPDTIQMSREYALLGNYETALVYFDGAVSQIQQYAFPLEYTGNRCDSCVFCVSFAILDISVL
jgi:hypothetical protein